MNLYIGVIVNFRNMTLKPRVFEPDSVKYRLKNLNGKMVILKKAMEDFIPEKAK
jgi:hypothetical protein